MLRDWVCPADVARQFPLTEQSSYCFVGLLMLLGNDLCFMRLLLLLETDLCLVGLLMWLGTDLCLVG